MRVALYVRISDDKEGAGLGVARQEADCRQRIPPGAEINLYVDNDRSAYSGKPRPDYLRMLADMRAGNVDLVVAWHADRLHRSPRELEEFIDVVEQHGVAVETVRAGMLDLATPAGRMVARQLGAVARYESEHKADRQRAKALELANAGKVSGGGHRPFGFEADRVTIRPEEATVIRELADRLLAGESLRSLCVDLEERGVVGVAGVPFTPTPLKRILRSARISGQREHRGQIVADAVWPAIITPEQTEQIRRILDDPARLKVRYTRAYLLRGLIRCGECNAILVSRPRGDKQRRYVCATGPRFVGCGRIYVLAEPLEEFVTEAVMEALDSPELADAIRGRDRARPSEWQQRADNARRRLDELAEAYAADKVSMREWLAAREPLQKQLDIALGQLAREAGTTAISEFVGQAGLLRKRWPDLSVDRRRAVIAGLLLHVRANAGRRGYNRFDPDRFELVWRHH